MTTTDERARKEAEEVALKFYGGSPGDLDNRAIAREIFLSGAKYGAEEMVKLIGELRADVLHGIDGLDNDQTNVVLGVIDHYFGDLPKSDGGEV